MVCGETIAAIATAPGRGGVAVIRVSGPDAFAIAERIAGSVPPSGRVKFARLRRDGVLDEALVLAFRGPHSYTGEDVVEFQCHGGTVTPRRVLEACFAAGARLARRGEFTQRAFLNGKLDYDQAESVLDLVDAKTDRAADAALEGLSGRKRRRHRELYEEALALSADLEHALDIDEGELPADFLPSVRSRVSCLASSLGESVRRAREGKILRDGALVVLSGPPNVGKSSLMNALLEENRAIVSETAGTTRDSIEEWMDLDGWPVRLVDTAGLRTTSDRVEAEGVRRAERLAASADVLLRLADSDGTMPTQGDARTLLVRTKCDLDAGGDCPPGTIRVSARTGEGLEALKAAVVRCLEVRFRETEDGPQSADERSQQLLTDARAGLVRLDGSDAVDLVLWANAVREASGRLGELVGATYSSDLLDQLFSRFCVGK